MKTFKKILLLLIYAFFLSLFALFLWKPYLLKVLKYRTPNAETYKIFPQEISHKSDSAFHFIRTTQPRNDLDTLHVQDGNNRLIPLKTYLKNGQINAFIVIRNDSVLYERYDKGYSDSTLSTLFSGAKSMISIMIGQALADGHIKSLNDKVTQYVPELKSNPAFGQITLKNLLDMKSGLEFKDALGGIVKAFFSDEAKYYYTDDMKAQLMKVKLVNKPGTVWVYKSIDPILLGWVLKKASGKSVAKYFETHIWKQVGAEYNATWGLDQLNGLTNTASRFQVTPIDLAKIGRLYLNKGRFNGSQVVPENWVNQSINIGNETPASAKGWQKSAHHYLWWIPQEGDKGDYAAEGMLGQRLYVDPKTNTIIVQFADHGAGNYPYRKISRYLSGLPFSYPKN
ncbi:serine hydrolase domain-containing protein [Pedobacter zeae]|uniref:6-aminohexanoate-dimer hydrolase n=1 Tax=Pedobacter zeae TaxID=1737356 RepID=A0A7W6KC26_9SPHI|nr:serine hydrolase [Pedobacter zeae]MBB4108989.1 CubicO group peptidase (beta-lactamase class C family) [Pedobacter zeae]GGH09578.1 6-aminohexanoate-dimer hydrolase [Pedobacter zeae]